MSLTDTAVAVALAAARQLAGVKVTYSDGTHTTPNINAAVGKTEYELEDSGAVVEKWTARDYLIAKSDLVLNGVVALPLKGYTLTEIINGISKVFAVLAPQGQQLWEYSDRAQTQLRIHTKEIA